MRAHAFCHAKFPAERQKELLKQEATKHRRNCDDQVELAFTSHVYEAEVPDRIVFQRFLGHLEILGGHRWQESTNCFMCQKWAYSIFVCDPKLSSDPFLFNSIDSRLLGNITQA